MEGEIKNKMEQDKHIQIKQLTYRFSPRTYIKRHGVPLVEAGFDQDDVRYYFSEQNVWRSNVAVQLPMPEFKQRDTNPNVKVEEVEGKQKARQKLKNQSDSQQDDQMVVNHHQKYKKMLEERNLRIVQPVITREKQRTQNHHLAVIQPLENRANPRAMMVDFDQWLINQYKKYLPIAKTNQRIIIKEKKQSRLKINELTRKVHLTLMQQKPVFLHRDKEFWMRQLNVRFYRSLAPAVTGKTLPIDVYRNDKKKSNRFGFLKLWLQVALTPMTFKAWQRITLAVILGFSLATSFSLLVLTKDMPTTGVDIGLDIYDVYYNGQLVGTTANKIGTQFAYQKVGEQLSEELGMEVELKHDLMFKPSKTEPKNPDSGQRALAAIGNDLEYDVYAIEIKMDGESVGVVKDKKSANQILEQLQQPFIEAVSTKALDWKVVGFKEKITFEPAVVEKDAIISIDDMVEQLMQVDQEKQTYIVQSGDSVSGIAQKYDLKTEQIMGLNPEIGSDYRLSIGDELVVVQPNYHYTVLTQETIECTQTLEYETEYIKDDSMFTTQIKTIKSGSLGEVKVVSDVKKENGVEVDRTIVSETILQEPVTEVLRIGTKEPALFIADSAGTGVFVWPTTGTVSSEFGPRWGGWHSGIDIANNSGTPIYAADSGTVTYSAYHSGGYGNLVKIYHGNGIETRYGHMVKRVAKQGEQVEKGQLIGYMGTTGRSTGNHLHFEVRVGGAAQNPRQFLN